MQQLPFVVVTNPHISEVYELYYNAFDTFRRVREVKTLEDNEKLCKVIGQMLADHLAVIPKLAMGVLECSDLMDSAELDKFMNTILRSVSRPPATARPPFREGFCLTSLLLRSASPAASSPSSTCR